MRQRAVGELFEAMDRMEAEGGMPMTEDEVQAEVDAVRAARRAARRASRGGAWGWRGGGSVGDHPGATRDPSSRSFKMRRGKSE